MGITGLLPALKSIQRKQQLSEFKGQTIAVDAYVWLHKGVYSCAVDLALGKSTKKYVDFAMERVRILRHFGIEPYIVFDGGPLPAKKGTESKRKQQRDEYLAQAKALTARGMHSEARDKYTKCVDVTPQMAYQLIKALKAESVQYVVAPYEADAQLAYLEKIGLVQGILTEDSDLLVFGCKTVLFKLDATAYTVVSIKQDDIEHVHPRFKVPEFRAMAILSGCDYLPSITGIGLKRACDLVRKWKSPEKAVRAIRLEGKKTVPEDYMENFQLADKCFQHQKVYCPREQKLVPLNSIPPDCNWTGAFEEYCGGDLEPGLAKRLAEGDVDPTTLLPMVDINPGYNPGSKKPASKTAAHRGKAKETVKPLPAGGILDFFGPNPIIPSTSKPSPVKRIQSRVVSAGQASGKRTLAGVMDDEVSRKKQKQRQNTPKKESKFFSGQPLLRRHTLDGMPGPSRLYDPEKENIAPEDLQQPAEDEADASDLSVYAQGRIDSEVDFDFDDERAADVEQEDGYMSPMSPTSPSHDAPDLSSPIQPDRPAPHKKQFFRGEQRVQNLADESDEEEFGSSFSSPTSANHRNHRFRSCSPRFVSSPIRDGGTPAPIISTEGERRSVSVGLERILVEDTPVAKRLFVVNATASSSKSADSEGISLDLRRALGVQSSSSSVQETDGAEASQSSSTPSLDTPLNPPDQGATVVIDVDEFDLFDMEEQRVADEAARKEAFRQSFTARFSYRGGTPSVSTVKPANVKGKVNATTFSALKRSHTNITPAGRHSLGNVKSASRAVGSASSQKGSAAKAVKKRASMATLNFFQPRRVEPVQRSPIFVADSDDEIVAGSSPASARMHHQIDLVGDVRTETRLGRFRYGQ